ncbi:MAG: hypothetical protein A3G81_25710 [Betaproteobacteria bacterium RIFCSPLOWO2_12_FULL_65_14]|nr:MAG: hypothetical protein A3G81_25710 [Betaproteobacteria bacterium RIFCSPLOWO2_12_FULL_65_14]
MAPRLLLAVLLLAAAASAGAADASAALPDEAKACLACHGTESAPKVDASAFAKSVHNPLGCTGCHAGVDPAKHPGAAKPERVSCAGCHADSTKHYQASVHAAQREKGNEGAPACATCHTPHEVSAAAVGEGLKDACLGCHAAAVETHQKWLPNTARHLEVVSCAACHAPSVQRKVDLRLHDGIAKKRVSEELVPGFGDQVKKLDKDGKGLDPSQLRTLLAHVEQEGKVIQPVLIGRIEIRNGAESHQLAGKASAVKDCQRCHRAGAEPFQSVTLSVLGTDGKTLRYDAQKEVLSSPTSVESVRGFYAIGGTRIGLLDVLLALALLAGISAPLAHLALRKLLRKKQG